MNVVTSHMVHWYLQSERKREKRSGCNVSLLNAGNELLAVESRTFNCPDLETSNLNPPPPTLSSHRHPVSLIRQLNSGLRVSVSHNWTLSHRNQCIPPVKMIFTTDACFIRLSGEINCVSFGYESQGLFDASVYWRWWYFNLLHKFRTLVLFQRLVLEISEIPFPKYNGIFTS